MADERELPVREQWRRKLWKTEKAAMRMNYRGRASADIESARLTYIGLDGTITLTELNTWAAEQGLNPDELDLNWLTIRWTEPPTPEEIEQDRAQEYRHRKATEKWERETLAGLKRKYEGTS